MCSSSRSGWVCRVSRCVPWYTPDRKSTRLNSSHLGSSYAVFCLKKKTHIHAGRVALDGHVDEVAHTRELDDLVELRCRLGLPHAEDGAVEIDVVAAAQLRVEAGA